MNKKIVKKVDSFVSKVLKHNIQSTTSITAYQPKLPAELKQMKK